jgi:hypothetical protein
VSDLHPGPPPSPLAENFTSVLYSTVCPVASTYVDNLITKRRTSESQQLLVLRNSYFARIASKDHKEESRGAQGPKCSKGITRVRGAK